MSALQAKLVMAKLFPSVGILLVRALFGGPLEALPGENRRHTLQIRQLYLCVGRAGFRCRAKDSKCGYSSQYLRCAGCAVFEREPSTLAIFLIVCKTGYHRGFVRRSCVSSISYASVIMSMKLHMSRGSLSATAFKSPRRCDYATSYEQ